MVSAERCPTSAPPSRRKTPKVYIVSVAPAVRDDLLGEARARARAGTGEGTVVQRWMSGSWQAA